MLSASSVTGAFSQAVEDAFPILWEKMFPGNDEVGQGDR